MASDQWLLLKRNLRGLVPGCGISLPARAARVGPSSPRREPLKRCPEHPVLTRRAPQPAGVISPRGSVMDDGLLHPRAGQGPAWAPAGLCHPEAPPGAGPGVEKAHAPHPHPLFLMLPCLHFLKLHIYQAMNYV